MYESGIRLLSREKSQTRAISQIHKPPAETVENAKDNLNDIFWEIVDLKKKVGISTML